MNREEKNQVIEELTQNMKEVGNFYLTDLSYMSVNEQNQLRQMLYKEGISMRVVKNTLVEKALENAEVENQQLKDELKGPISIIFCETVNQPAKIIQKFRDKGEKPVVKLAYLQETLFVGDDKLEELTKLKSKEDLIGDVLQLLQSPMSNLVSSLQSAQNDLTGVLKTLSNRESNE